MSPNSRKERKPLISLEEPDEMNFSIDGDDDLQLQDPDAHGISHYGSDVTRPVPKGGPIEQWEAYEVEERRQVGGAAAAGALAGLMFGGPIGALILGVGAAAVATTRGKAGDVSRATGEAMAKAGDRLKELDEQHHISDKAVIGVKKSADWFSNKLKAKEEQMDIVSDGLTA